MLGLMRSVADDLRTERVRRELALTLEERIELALALHRRDVELYRHAFEPPLSAEEASRRLARNRRNGRVFSACIAALDR